jgi:hypothetical protein
VATMDGYAGDAPAWTVLDGAVIASTDPTAAAPAACGVMRSAILTAIRDPLLTDHPGLPTDLALNVGEC